MAGFRGLLYTLAKLMGDYNAVKKGKVGKWVGLLATSKSGTLLLRRDQGETAVFWDSRSRRL